MCLTHLGSSGGVGLGSCAPVSGSILLGVNFGGFLKKKVLFTRRTLPRWIILLNWSVHDMDECFWCGLRHESTTNV